MAGSRIVSDTSLHDSEDFIDSIGVNTHLSYLKTPYGNSKGVASALDYLGIHHVRDSIFEGNNKLLQVIDALGAAGVSFDFLLSHVELQKPTGLAWTLGAIADRAGITSAIEGPNETDLQPITWEGSTGLAATRALMEDLASAVRSTPDLASIPIIQASFGRAASYAQVGDIAGFADFANTHTYFGNAVAPEAVIESRIAEAARIGNPDRVITTESGYPTALGVTTGTVGVTESVQAALTTRMLLEQFRHGIERTYVYELYDLATSPAAAIARDNWGLYRSDGTPKPAAVGIHNLTSLLSKDAGPHAEAPLDYDVSARGTVHHLLFQRDEGDYALVLWNEVNSWNATTAAPVKVAPVKATVSFETTSVDFKVFDILGSIATPVARAQDRSSFTVMVPDHPVVVELGDIRSTAGVPDRIVLRVAGDSWQGEPQFQVLIGGTVLDEVHIVTTAHSTGAWQSVVITGDFGAENVSVRFLNDASGDAPGADRNLYVGGCNVNGTGIAGTAGTGGVRVPGSRMLEHSGDTVTFATAALLGGGRQATEVDTIRLRLSGDSWQGAPKFQLLVDDIPVGAPTFVTASHAAGRWQEIEFKGDFSAAEEVRVRYLNDTAGTGPNADRNLYVDRITVGTEVYEAEQVPDARLSGNAAALYHNSDLLFLL